MNFYTLASKLNKKMDATIRQFRPLGQEDKFGVDEDKAREIAERQAMYEFEKNTRLGIRLMKRFKEIAKEEGLYQEAVKTTYFITIRPDTSSVNFQEFFMQVEKFVARRCFIWFKLSFEQKGTNPETYGQGFHAHIVAHMKQRSKSEVLRDTVSTFKNCTSANCIQVDILKSKEDVDNTIAYITEYTSDDDHKEKTKEGDAAWRTANGLKELYTEEDLDNSHLPSIKSMVGQVMRVSTPATISWA